MMKFLYFYLFVLLLTLQGVFSAIEQVKKLPDLNLKINQNFELTIDPYEYFKGTQQDSRIYVFPEPNEWISTSYINPSIESSLRSVQGYDVYFPQEPGVVLVPSQSSGILILNVSDPSKPFEIGRITKQNLVTSAYDPISPHVYLVVEDSSSKIELQVYDFTNLKKPVLSGSTEIIFEGYYSGALVNMYYMVDYVYIVKHKWPWRIQIFEVKNPTNPRFVAERDASLCRMGGGPSISGCKDMIPDSREGGDFGYVAGDSVGVRIWNITNKTEPVVINSLDRNGATRISIDVTRNFLYVLRYDGKIDVVNITSDPTNAYFLTGSYSPPEKIKAVASVGSEDGSKEYIVYQKDSTGYFGVADVTDPTPASISEIGQFFVFEQGLSCEVKNVRVADQFVYIVKVTEGQNDMKIFSVSNATDVKMVFDSYEGFISWTRDIFVVEKENIVYVTDTYGGVKVFDLGKKKSSNIELKFSALGGSYISGVNLFDENMMSVSVYGKKVSLYDVSDPSKFVFLGSCDVDQTIRTGKYSKNVVIVAAEEKGVRFLDISNTSNPRQVSGVSTEGAKVLFAQSEEDYKFLYVADGIGGIKILDISNTSTPFLVGEYRANGIEDVVALGPYAYSAAANDGVKFFDLTNKKEPTLISGLDFGGYSTRIAVKGDTCVVSDTKKEEFKFLDVSNLEDVKIVAKLEAKTPDAIQFVGNYIVTSDQKWGLNVIKTDLKIAGSLKNFDYFCGTTSIELKVRDGESGEERVFSFKINKEDYCNGHGKCLERYGCSCLEEYEGDSCETWSCGGYDYKELGKTCTGNGVCKNPETCECNFGFSGDTCDENILYATVMAPALSVASVGIIVLIVVVAIMVVICCCFGILFLICCFVFLIFGIICCFCCCFCVCTCCFLNQMRGLKRFKKLKNFDLLLKEQEIEEDLSIAHIKVNKRLFEIGSKDIEMISILGEGGSASVVYKAKWRGREVAYKCFKTRTVCETQNSFNEFEREVQVMSSVNHPNIVQFFGACLHPPRVGIVMEYCEKGDLWRFVKFFKTEHEGFSYPLHEKLRMAHEISSSLEYLHSGNILHRDLKMENVLVDETNSCKLMDFGLSKIVDQMSVAKTKRIGTSYYMAPEILASGKYDEKVDNFSYAMLLFIFFTEEMSPYGNVGSNTEMRVMQDPSYRPDISKLDDVGDGSEKGRRIIEFVKDIVENGWNHDPSSRTPFSELNKRYESFLEQKNEAITPRSNPTEMKREEEEEELIESCVCGRNSQISFWRPGGDEDTEFFPDEEVEVYVDFRDGKGGNFEFSQLEDLDLYFFVEDEEGKCKFSSAFPPLEDHNYGGSYFLGSFQFPSQRIRSGTHVFSLVGESHVEKGSFGMKKKIVVK